MCQGCALGPAGPMMSLTHHYSHLHYCVVCLPSCSAVPGNVGDTLEPPVRAKVAGLLLFMMSNMKETGWPREWQYNDNLERSVPWWKDEETRVGTRSTELS